MPEFQTTPGTRDILPPDAARWRAFIENFATVVERAGFEQIILPMFEDLGVFLRLGEATDIVTKEMYDFADKGGRRLALRPEGTAGTVRAFVEHPFHIVKNLFRHRKVRYRGLAKNGHQLYTLFGLANIVIGARPRPAA